jgi:hypothetical protein
VGFFAVLLLQGVPCLDASDFNLASACSFNWLVFYHGQVPPGLTRSQEAIGCDDPGQLFVYLFDSGPFAWHVTSAPPWVTATLSPTTTHTTLQNTSLTLTSNSPPGTGGDGLSFVVISNCAAGDATCSEDPFVTFKILVEVITPQDLADLLQPPPPPSKINCPTPGIGGMDTSLSMQARARALAGSPKDCSVTIVDTRTRKPPNPIVWVGQHVQLAAMCGCGGTPSMTHWSILDADSRDATARDSAVADYVVNQSPDALGANDGSIKVLGWKELDSPDLSFYFLRAGTYTVRVDTEFGTAKVEFTVKAPAVVSCTTTCGVGINTRGYASPNTGILVLPTTMGLGLNDTCGRSTAFPNGVPGIIFAFAVSADNGGSGIVRMTQLITRTRAHNGTICAGDSPFRLADFSSFYNPGSSGRGTQVHVPDGGTATWTDSDSPFVRIADLGQFVPPGDTWTEAFNADDYPMYKTDKAGSVWVPLGHLAWSWSGTSDAIIGGFQLTLFQNPPLSPAYVDSPGQIPEWPGAARPQNLPC